MRRSSKVLVVAMVLSLVVAACASDNGDDKATSAATAAPAATTAVPTTTTAAATASTVEEDAAFDYSAFDANGDGVITIGVAAAGPADDGAYYQAVVDAAIELSEANGFEAPIVVDKIEAANAATELSNLAEQGVDIIIVGASEIAEPLPDLTEKYSDIFWYCNCGAGFASLPGLAQSLDDSSEISYTAGYASGLLLQDRGSTVAYFIGCCDLNFEMEALLSFEMGLQAVDSAFTVTYVPTGDWPYDFDNVPNATEAFNTAVAEGVGVVYPYLGGAHEAIVQLANENGVAALSAGPSDVCTREGDLTWDIAVRFDGGDYVAAIFPQIFAGDVVEGETKVFRVGVDSEPGAVICNATADQQAAMDSVYAEIASGAFAGEFGAIKGAAYGG
jgi:basic membrane protein A